MIEAKWQYSSIEGPLSDPNLLKYPNLNAEPWERCLNIAELVYNGLVAADPVRGATHYYDSSIDPPIWVPKMIHTTDVGDFHFYKPAA